MKLRAEYLAGLLHDFRVTQGGGGAAADVNGVYLLTGRDNLCPGMLYLGMASQLPAELPDCEDTLALLCVEDVPVPESCREGANILLLTCPEGTPVGELFNRVNGLFAGRSRTSDRLWAFLGEIADSSNFTQLMGSVASIMGCSCALLSQGFKMLGYCQLPDAETTCTWEPTLKRKYYPHTDLISQLRQDALTVFDVGKRRIVSDPEQYPETGDAFFPLLSEDSSREVLGFLYFSYCDRESFFSRVHEVEFISYALSFRMWRYMNSPANSNSALCFLMRDVINGAMNDDGEIARRLENIHFVPSTHTFLIVVYSSAMDNRKYSWRHLRTVFAQLFPDDVLMTYNGEIVLLVSSCESSRLPEERLEALTQLLREHDCFAGISSCFSRLDRSLKNHYARTLAAAKMARSHDLKNRYTTYADVALLHLIQEGTSAGNLRDLCDPRVLRLASYDRSHGSNYIYTMQCYWHFNQNIQKTCDYLYIHRNTLFYRLKKIKEIADLDFNNSKHLLQCNLSFAILTALGDIPFNDFPDAPGEDETESGS